MKRIFKTTDFNKDRKKFLINFIKNINEKASDKTLAALANIFLTANHIGDLLNNEVDNNRKIDTINECLQVLAKKQIKLTQPCMGYTNPLFYFLDELKGYMATKNFSKDTFDEAANAIICNLLPVTDLTQRNADGKLAVGIAQENLVTITYQEISSYMVSHKTSKTAAKIFQIDYEELPFHHIPFERLQEKSGLQGGHLHNKMPKVSSL